VGGHIHRPGPVRSGNGWFCALPATRGAAWRSTPFFVTATHRLWLGTDRGLYLVRSQPRHVPALQYAGTDAQDGSEFVTSIAEGKGYVLWIGTEKGLFKLDFKSGTLVAYGPGARTSDGLKSDWIKVLHPDKRGNLWVGTHGGGVSVLDPSGEIARHFEHDPADPWSLAHNDVLSMAEDGAGKLWIGTENGGISIYDRLTDRFTSVRNSPDDRYSLSNNSVYAIYQDNAKNIWIGTYAGGVSFLPKFGPKFDSYGQKVNQSEQPEQQYGTGHLRR
jgi:hypothetical protein